MRKWSIRVGIAALVLIVLVVVALPLLVAPMLRTRVCTEISERLGLAAELDEVSISWLGKVELTGLRVTTEAGEPVAMVPQAVVEVSIARWLKGTLWADVLVEGAALTARQEADGTWDVDAWLKRLAQTDETSDGETPDAPQSPTQRGSVVELSFQNSQAQLYFRDGTTVNVNPLNGQFTQVTDPTSGQHSATGLSGHMDLELQPVATPWVTAGGSLVIDVVAGATTWESKFRANRGDLVVSGAADLRALMAPITDQPATLNLKAAGVELTSELSQLASLLHPAFAAIEGSSIIGRIDGDLDLNYQGPLGADSFQLNAIQANGHFAPTGLRFDSTPTLQQMLQILGADSSSEVLLKPVAFTVRNGRLTYDKPWAWTIGDVSTNFTGTLGLDGSLDLSWNIPVTDAVAEYNSVLSLAKGKTIQLPIRGTTQAPDFEWSAALRGLASTVDGGILTGDLSQVIDEVIDDEPALLLKEADDLWDAGNKLEAAKLYREIRSEHNRSLVYLLQRSRIKSRGKYTGSD